MPLQDLAAPFDSPREACGVIGIWDASGTFNLPDYLVLGLTELQHRGQESAGIAVCAGDSIETRVGMGKVREVFPHGAGEMRASVGIGHVRYSTTGSSCVQNAGPFLVGRHGEVRDQLALAHNGNVSNSDELAMLLGDVTLDSTTDSEIVAHLLLAAKGETFVDRMRSVIPLLRGAYSFVILSGGKLYGLRDPLGMRPLCLGTLGRGWILASESGAIEKLGGAYERDVRPGELIEIGEDGLISTQLVERERHAFCSFEYIYFAGAASSFDGRSVYAVRQELGRQLAHEHPAPGADVVSGVPDSAVPAAIAYAAEVGLPYTEAFIKSRYSERSFIKPDQRLRRLEVDLKFSIVRHNVAGKSVVLVDDSIVRGNTMKRAIAALRNYGAREVHLRISSPPLRNPCFYGIDIGSDEDLIAAHADTERIAAYIGADSLGYLSLEGLAQAVTLSRGEAAGPRFHNGHCYGCFQAQGYPYSAHSAFEEQRERALASV
ncbi:MAG: amidophosphoribosyltransferase [Chloroflexota bacterium]|nr:amidophosphoribosyltransferase [Chloroflexota bacterium]